MQTKKERERLVTAYHRGASSAFDTARCAMGLAVLVGIAMFGANVDPQSPELVARLESEKGRLGVEQASVRSRNDVYQLRRATHDRMIKVEPASLQSENAMANVSAGRNAAH